MLACVYCAHPVPGTGLNMLPNSVHDGISLIDVVTTGVVTVDAAVTGDVTVVIAST